MPNLETCKCAKCDCPRPESDGLKWSPLSKICPACHVGDHHIKEQTVS